MLTRLRVYWPSLTLFAAVTQTSRLIHDLLFPDTSESLCSRAWRLQRQSRFWLGWTYVFGRGHCQKSHRHYWG